MAIEAKGARRPSTIVSLRLRLRRSQPPSRHPSEVVQHTKYVATLLCTKFAMLLSRKLLDFNILILFNSPTCSSPPPPPHPWHLSSRNSPKVSSFPFLSQLKLRSAINLSAEPIHDKALHFFLGSGVAMVSEPSLALALPHYCRRAVARNPNSAAISRLFLQREAVSLVRYPSFWKQYICM